MRAAAVSYVERDDGRILVVWNRRYGGFTLPGGKVEDEETPAQAMRRELREETGMYALAWELLYSGMTTVENAPEDRGRIVYVFRVTESGGIAEETEIGCPVSWFTRGEFLKWTCFKDFYRRMFALCPVPTKETA